MHRTHTLLLRLLCLKPSLVSLIVAVTCNESPPRPGPIVSSTQTYKTVDGVELKAHIHAPGSPAPPAGFPAAVLLHGGGWSMGEPAWMTGRAERLASLGMLAVAVQYRLSDQKAVTPLEAMEDVRDAIRWMRRNAASLRVDPERIAALGVSAGGHLAMAAAVIDHERAGQPSSAANAFVLWYPALSVAQDRWLERILLGRAPVASIDPAAHVRPGLGPTLIFVGVNDSLTPLAGQQLFCQRMRQAGNACTVQTYPGLGHLFMKNPWGEGNEPSDSAARADASVRAEQFLDSLGYLKLPDRTAGALDGLGPERRRPDNALVPGRAAAARRSP
jgi:acetyl esterase/lipase